MPRVQLQPAPSVGSTVGPDRGVLFPSAMSNRASSVIAMPDISAAISLFPSGIANSAARDCIRALWSINFCLRSSSMSFSPALEVTAKQADVAIVRLEINVEDRAENRDASYDRIQQHVPQHAGDQALSSAAVSGSQDDVRRDHARRRISEYGHQTYEGIQPKTN